MKHDNITSRSRQGLKPAEANLAAALELAEAGYRVFPVGPDKMPRIKWKAGATTDAARVRSWWRKWPDSMPGLPTGQGNGLAVLDLDLKGGKDGAAELARLGLDVAHLSHVAVATPTGGRHLYFRHRPGLKNSASGIAPGVDTRGDGGYVVAPGAVLPDGRSYAPMKGDLAGDVIGLPAWPAALKVPAKPAQEAAPARLVATDADSTWAQAEVARVMAALRAAEAGGRNAALNAAAHYLGGIVSVGLLSRQEVEFALLSAAAGNGLLKDDGAETCKATIASGCAAGRKDPRFPPPPDVDVDRDFDDLDDDPDADIAYLLGDAPKPAKAAPGGLTFLSPAECADRPTRRYVVKGLVAEGDVAAIVGAPGVGKSLIAPRIGYAVAQGQEVFGLKTRQGGVFYVAAEDESGMCARVTALRQEHGEADAFTLVGGVTSLFPGGADLLALRRAVKERRPSLVIIDTLAMSFPGLKENEADSMGLVVKAARALTKWGAAVILIHHDTKAGEGLPRGHSILNGALDMSLHLVRESGVVRGSPTKNRNGPSDLDIAFTIRTQRVGQDDDGESVFGAICHEMEPGQAQRHDRLSPAARAALDILRGLSSDGPVDLSIWRDACEDSPAVSAAEDKRDRRKTFQRLVTQLAQRGRVHAHDDQYSLAGDILEGFDNVEE